MNTQARKYIGFWLLLGAVLIFIQVIIGGVTRLTGSGLSITEWQPIVGSIPPLSESQWTERFEQYQQIAQFKHINQDMTIGNFKFIFFWEYFHRLWARFLGAAFALPFAYFIYKKWIDRANLFRIGAILVWGGIIGLYGWIMVKNGLSGLYVPPIFLSIHLILALSLYSYLIWLAADIFYRGAGRFPAIPNSIKIMSVAAFSLLFFQILIGGIVSGMKAGLFYPTWPDMNGELIPNALFAISPSLSGITQYNPNDAWSNTAIQFIHRFVAYSLLALIIALYYRLRKKAEVASFKLFIRLLPFTVLLQVIIGVVTVLNCRGSIPVFWGVTHQAGAMILLANVTAVLYFVARKRAKI